MGINFGTFDALTPEPIEIAAGGNSAIVLDAAAFAPGSTLRVVAMGVTQHPKSNYTYAADGRSFTLPAPLGTFINPIYTCRDLGAYITAYDDFKVIVRNDDDVAHKYAAYLLYIADRSA